jgi:2-oxoglutarate dehydrogenase complex dehydrogenase (E1) component-like enzyme
MNEHATNAGLQSLAYMEQIYADFRRNPKSVLPEWQEYFVASANGDHNGNARLGPSFRPRSVFNPGGDPVVRRQEFHPDPRAATVSERLYQLVRNHRVRGHNIAAVDPLGVPEATRIHDAIAGSKLELFGDCGHWPQHEQAERYNPLSIEFLLASE